MISEVDKLSTSQRKEKEMTNTELLRKKIDESGYKLLFIAEKCGLSYQGFMNKVNGKSEFNAPEITKLRALLEMSPEEVECIFFASVVDK